MLIRAMTPADWPPVRDIYAQGIAGGDATFELEPPPWAAWDAAHLPHSRLVAVGDDQVTGWAALSAVSDRCVYGGVAEVSVYVASEAQRRGVGGVLLQALVDESERNGIWTLQAGIFPENKASVIVHERCGFRLVGRRERIGQMRGVWRDTLIMERRSKAVG